METLKFYTTYWFVLLRYLNHQNFKTFNIKEYMYVYDQQTIGGVVETEGRSTSVYMSQLDRNL